MKVLLILLLGLTLSTPAQLRVSLMTLDAADAIVAGDEWTLSVRAPLGQVGDAVRVSLLSGLQRYETTLTLGSGGVARWEMPQGTLTTAGNALVVARLGDTEATRTLVIQPDITTRLEALTTTNALQSYGEGQAMIVALPQDTYGNLVMETARTRLIATFPDGTERLRSFRSVNGILWRWFPSQGTPGRVRLRVQADGVQAALELRQIAGVAADVSLAVRPDCVVSTDERDSVTLTAMVRDTAGEPVAEGTLVQFAWGGGLGTAPTLNGQAQLRLPAPPAGQVEIVAAVGRVQSEPVRLTVSADGC